MSMRVNDVQRMVAAIDQTKQAEQFRNPDRPDGRAVPRRASPRDPEIIRAQSRLRVAAWRNEQDRRRAPTTAQVGMALVMALVKTQRLGELKTDDPGIVGKALVDLSERGFSLNETLASLKRLQDRVRHSEAVENGAAGPGRR